MPGYQSWSPITGMDEWMTQQEKRVAHEERRPLVRTAADIMGPGLAPHATPVSDWNSEETRFNGIFYSEPDIGVQHSPDPASLWIGVSYATEDGRGYQQVWDDSDPVISYTRTFTTLGDSTEFTDWVLLATGGGGVGPPGPPGPPGGSSSVFDYRAKTPNTSGDPGAGNLQWNNTTQASATALLIDIFDAHGLDVTIGLITLVPGDIFYFQDIDNSTHFQKWKVLTVTDSTGYYTVGVSLVDSAGGNFANNTELAIQVLRTGMDEVIPWPTGSEPSLAGVPDGTLWVEYGTGATAGGIGFTFVQAVAASTWVIDHSLPIQPNVTTVDSTGRQVEGDVVYTDTDTITITFSAAFAGKAYLS